MGGTLLKLQKVEESINRKEKYQLEGTLLKLQKVEEESIDRKAK